MVCQPRKPGILCQIFLFDVFHNGEFKDSPNLGLYDVSLGTGFLISSRQVRNNLPETQLYIREVLYSYGGSVVVRNGHSIMHLHIPS